MSDGANKLTGSHAVRWYIMVLPAVHKGDTARMLRMEAERNAGDAGAVFEYFAPKYIEVKRKGRDFVRTERPLLYNYVFIRSSEAEIYRRQRGNLHAYNFLPRVRNGSKSHYPYLSDAEMQNIRWMAKAYSGVLPVYVPEAGQLVKGDRVRITEGQFAGVEATVAVQPGAGHKDVMVCIEGSLWVPLMRVSPGQYEVIELNEDGRHMYTKLSNDRIFQQLHEALHHYHSAGGVTDSDRAVAEEALRNYAHLQMDSDVMRCKLASILLMAYTLSGNEAERAKLESFSRAILPLLKAEQSRALLLVTLYGCTDSNKYYHEAHAQVLAWRNEPDLKKSKRQLLLWLDHYDEWLGHQTK